MFELDFLRRLFHRLFDPEMRLLAYLGRDKQLASPDTTSSDHRSHHPLGTVQREAIQIEQRWHSTPTIPTAVTKRDAVS